MAFPMDMDSHYSILKMLNFNKNGKVDYPQISCTFVKAFHFHIFATKFFLKHFQKYNIVSKFELNH